MRGIVVAAAMTLGASMAGPAQARLIRVSFSGTVDHITAGYEVPGINVGDAIAGALVYESTTPDGQPLDWIGFYGNAIQRLELTIAGRPYVFQAASEIDVINDDLVFSTYHDNLFFRAMVADAATPGVPLFFQLTFAATGATPPTMLQSDALVESLDLNALAVRRGFITPHPPGASTGNEFQLAASTMRPAVARRDFDGDARSDVLWRNAATGENYVYPMNGTQILSSEGYVRTVADQAWQVAGIGDFDGDGKADVLWRNSSSGENYVYLMNGKEIAGEGYLRTVADQNWKVAGVGDLDGDGKADVLWRNSSSGENYLYPMDGLSIKGSEGYLRTVANQDWQVAGIGDFDGDLKADILWRNSATGENYLYPMSGTTILGTEGFIRTVADLNWKIVSTGDFDGDGKADLLWRNSSTGENYLYPMNGTAVLGTEGYVRTVPDQNWQVKGTGDFDGDGKADVLWRHATSGENYLYFMDGTTIKPTEGFTRTVADQNWRVAPGVQGAPVPVLADVVIALDTSGDMGVETAFVQALLNSFAAAVKSAGIDLNVVVIASSEDFCAPAPLGSGACPADENLPGYRHVPVGIASNDAFEQILASHPQWSGSMRAGSHRTLIVVTSDESGMSSSAFTTQLLALDPAFAAMRFDAIVATVRPGLPVVDPTICTGIGSAIGTQYINLAAQTGGIVGNLCEQEFAPFFDSFAAAIVSGFP